jgi:hypothetical protein
MKDLRNLLLDVRSALRRHDRNFDNSPLRGKLDETLLELAKPDEKKDDAPIVPETFAAQQVAYAWQIAARNLRLTHPELHARMVARVHEMLDADVVHDPATEIMMLQARFDTHEVAHKTDSAELAALRKDLADAVTLSGREAVGTESECAQRRLRILIAAASQGRSLPKLVADDPTDLAHTREELEAVLHGTRKLSRWERAWCVAEALVMTGKTTAELQALDDAVLVKMVLSGTSTAPSN